MILDLTTDAYTTLLADLTTERYRNAVVKWMTLQTQRWLELERMDAAHGELMDQLDRVEELIRNTPEGTARTLLLQESKRLDAECYRLNWNMGQTRKLLGVER